MSEIANPSVESALCVRFEAAMAAANSEPLVRRGRTLNADCVVQIGTVPFLLRIQGGRVVDCTRRLPLLCSTQFSITASTAAWKGLWERMPTAGRHDLFALSKSGELSFAGNMQLIMAHLQFLKDLLALPREGGAQ